MPKQATNAKNKSMTPQQIKATYDRAMRLTQAGKGKQAEDLWRKLIEVDPNSAVFWNNLGVALEHEEKFDDAIASYERALAVKPLAETHYALAKLFYRIGNHKQAIEHAKICIEMDESDSEAWRLLGKCFYSAEKTEHAIFVFLKLYRELSRHEDLLYLCFSLKEFDKPVYRQDLREALLLCIDDKRVPGEELIAPWLAMVGSDPSLEKLKLLLSLPSFEALCMFAPRLLEDQGAFWEDSLFLKGIELLRLRHAPLENCLAHIRHFFLQRAHDGEEIPFHTISFLAALSKQCFLNEYVWPETPQEAMLVSKLEKTLTASKGKAADIGKFLVFSCYRPVSRFSEVSWPVELSANEPLQSIFQLQVTEPKTERELASSIKSIGTIQNSVTSMVREQYEVNPYPRWRYTTAGDPASVRTLPRAPKRCSMLIAGCGTGRQIAHSRHHFPNSHITAIDISLASLGYAARKMVELGFDNVDFYHADILNLTGLKKKFDVVECTGVLHHMEDPLKGWSILTDLLNPGGLMKIGLYSEIARQHVVLAHRIIKDNSFERTPEGIRACRELIKQLPPANPVTDLLNSPDFYTLSTCRDLLFHVQEHRFTIPQIQEALQTLGLKFVGFEVQRHSISNAFKTSFPEPLSEQNLENWSAFEQDNPKCFRGMYQFWCKKS